MPKVAAKPVAPLARLQTATPMPTSHHRETRWAIQPKIGAVSI